MIELRNISKTYHTGQIPVHVLKDVSLKIDSGEFVAIMGPSGSGKSTLLHILGFLDTPDKGEYLIDENLINNLSDDELATLRNNYAGFVFQQFHLLRRMSALTNVGLPFIYSQINETKDIEKKANISLETVDLSDRASHWPSELSGGQQQRVAIARALIKDPQIIFADEPTGNLDMKSEAEIMQILKSLHEKGKTIIMVTHEREVAQYAQRILVMRDGKIISDEKISSANKGKLNHKINITSLKRNFINKRELIVHIKQAFNAIISNKVRSLLSMLGILVGVASVVAMVALGEGAKSSMEEQLRSLGSNLLSIRSGSSRYRGASGASGSITRFTPFDIEAIKAIKPNVKRISGQVGGNVQVVHGNENANTRLQGVGLEYGDMRATIPAIGRWFYNHEIKEKEKVAVIGFTIVEKLFRNENPIGKLIKINRINFKVIGIAPAKGFTGPNDQDDIIYIPITTAMHRVLGKNYLDNIFIEVLNADLIPETKEKLENLIKNRHKIYAEKDSFQIRDMSEIQDMLSSTTKTMSLLLGCIAAISLIVGGIGIMNIMLVSVTERTREIGLRKAIGARKIDIMMQFLIESVVMTLSGGILGIFFGVGCAALLSFLAGWVTKISIFPIFFATTFSIFVGVCFGLWPAKRASELKPVEALRYE